MSGKELVAFLFFLYCWLLVIPFLSYGTYQFYLYRELRALKQRDTSIVVYFNVAIIIYWALLVSLWPLFLSHFSYFGKNFLFFFLRLFCVSLYPFYSYAIVCMFLYRYQKKITQPKKTCN